MGDAAGTAAPPGVLTEEQEGKLLAPWVLGELGHLRWNWGDDAYGFGVLPGPVFAAWRLDGSGEPMTHENLVELGRLVRADYIRRPVPRDDVPAEGS